MPQKLTLAVSQSRTLSTLAATLAALAATAQLAAQQNVDLILFPEAYLGGYPRTCTFGASMGFRSDAGREQYLQYFHSAVDLGDTPTGADSAWIERKLPLAPGAEHRGDGTRETLERIAHQTGVFIVTGLVERSGGTLYCSVVYVCPQRGCIGKRRKVMPTGSERLVWGQGSASTLRAVTATIKGVKLTMAAAICWENMMPLLRYALYSQNVNLWLAPTADARDTWLSLMRTVGNEGRCFVLSAISCVKRRNLPAWASEPVGVESAVAVAGGGGDAKSPVLQQQHQTNGTGRRRSTISMENRHELVLPAVEEYPASKASAAAVPPDAAAVAPKEALSQPATNGESSAYMDDFVCRGGSCMIGPLGQVLAGPLWEVEDDGLLIQEVDFEDCERGRLDLDVAGSYSRSDAFKLTVEGLDISPPP